MCAFAVRPITPADRERVARWITEHWGDDLIVVHGTSYQPSALPGFIAYRGDEWIGLVTYHIQGAECEIITLNSLCPSMGIGTALLEAVKEAAQSAHCRRLWLITTNDNLNALRFYQKRGFVLVAVHRGAVEEARKRKPQIPIIGEHSIPLRDEIELELLLPASPQ